MTVSSSTDLEKGPYELTEVDVFSLKKSISGSDIAVYGVTIESTLADALAKLNKTKADIKVGDTFGFLDVKPGFRIRFKNQKINALLIGDDFKANLVGATAELFNNIDSAENFKNYVTKFFMKPDKYNDSTIAGSNVTSIVYMFGLEFTRFSRREGTTCMMCFQPYGL